MSIGHGRKAFGEQSVLLSQEEVETFTDSSCHITGADGQHEVVDDRLVHHFQLVKRGFIGAERTIGHKVVISPGEFPDAVKRMRFATAESSDHHLE